MSRRPINLTPYENDMETAEEFTPDPFSEEPHSFIHKKRYSKLKNTQNNEIFEENKY